MYCAILYIFFIIWYLILIHGYFFNMKQDNYDKTYA